ncbi:MAG: GNAT family N-acetyltransferase [Planctomycetota bacterium]
MRLRDARDEDSAGVITLIESCYAEYPPNVLDVDGEEPELRAPASSFDRFWVVEGEDGAIVGCIAVALAGRPVAELKKCYVGRPLRGQGWGRRLVAEVEAAAAAAGCTAVELWTDTRFTLAHRVYQALGYRPSGRTRELHDLSQTTEYHYAKRLTEGSADAQG